MTQRMEASERVTLCIPLVASGAGQRRLVPGCSSAPPQALGGQSSQQGWASGQPADGRPSLLTCTCPSPTADKYCPLLIKEGGMPLLRDVIKMATARQETKEMAR